MRLFLALLGQLGLSYASLGLLSRHTMVTSCMALRHFTMQVNKGILKDGFPLPDIPHVKVERANVTVANNAIALGTDLSYVQ